MSYDDYDEDLPLEVKEPDFNCKMVVIGDSNVGKSNLISRCTNNIFREGTRNTVGVEFGIKSFDLDDKMIKATIWDTAGQDRFKVLTKGYYRGSQGALIVYDITNKTSFDNVSKWLEELRSSVTEDVQIMLVGNKLDLEDQRQVSVEAATKFARENELSFIETSAKIEGPEGNVDKAFRTIISEIYKKFTENQIDGSANPNDEITGSMRIVEPPTEEPADVKKKCCTIL